MYQLIFEKRALEELNKLDKQIKERIWKKLQDCKEDPFRFLEFFIAPQFTLGKNFSALFLGQNCKLPFLGALLLPILFF